MKKAIILLLTIVTFLFSCSSSKTMIRPVDSKEMDVDRITYDNQIKEIRFQFKYDDGDFGIYASIENPEEEMSLLVGADEVVLNKKKVYILFDYPLDNELIIEATSPNKKGFTKADLIRIVSKTYHLIYKEEERTTTQVIPVGPVGGFSNGKYGVWGNHISQLVLGDIYAYELEDGNVFLSLGISS